MKFLTYDTVIDLGSRMTRIALRGRGLVLEEPTVVAVGPSGQAAAAGEEALAMAARNPGSCQLVYPVRCGAVSDARAAGELVRMLMRRAVPRRFALWGTAVVPVPVHLSEVERRAVEQAVHMAGAAETVTVTAGLAAAAGAGLELERPQASAVVDIGAGVITAGVYALNGAVAEHSVPTGADEWEGAIAAWIRREHEVAVSEQYAGELKLLLADVYAPRYQDTRPVRGRDVNTGLPVTVDIGAEELYQALEASMDQLFEAVTGCLAQTPPELAADVLRMGLTLCGGGSRLRGLHSRLSQALGVPVHECADPDRAAVLGALSLWERGLLSPRSNRHSGRRKQHV